MVRRLCVPATPKELAALFNVPVRTIRATLHQLKQQGRVRQIDRYVGRERLWQANGSGDQIRELTIRDAYDRYLAHEAEWSEVTRLIAQRSPRQVERMEFAKGLR